MPQRNQMSNDFNLTIALHIEVRNFRLPLARIFGGLVTLAILGVRAVMWFTAHAN